MRLICMLKGLFSKESERIIEPRSVYCVFKVMLFVFYRLACNASAIVDALVFGAG